MKVYNVANKDGTAFYSSGYGTRFEAEELLKIAKLHDPDAHVVEYKAKSELEKMAEERAKLLARIPRWISVEERPPENDEPVLVSAEKQGLNGKVYNVVFTAFHTDGTTHTEESGYTWDNRDDLGFKYCEDTNDYLIPEAWWEDVRYGEEYAKIPDYVNITHWMPLPQPPKEVVTHA